MRRARSRAGAKIFKGRTQRNRTSNLELRGKVASSAGDVTRRAEVARAAERTKLQAVRSRAASPSLATAGQRIPISFELAARMADQLPEMSYANILKFWKNCLIQVATVETRNATPATKLIAAIDKEWNARGAQPVDPNEFFRWPTTAAPDGEGGISFTAALTEGMLAYLEYHVGRTKGEGTLVRRAILTRVFEGALPPIFPADYLLSWGRPRTSTRLRKLAECLAAFVRNFKRRHDDRFDDAIQQWEADLRFLHDEYYVGRFGFGWPDSRV